MLINKKGLELYEKFKKLHNQENIRRLNQGLKEEGWYIIENDEYIKTPEDVIGLYIYAYDSNIINIIKDWIEGIYEGINDVVFNGINLTLGQLLKSIPVYYDMHLNEQAELLYYIKDKYANLLIKFMNEEANNEQLEDFLGYQISADIIERKEEAIKEMVTHMPSEKLEKYIERYTEKTDNLKYYEICIGRTKDLDELGKLKPNARDWLIYIQGYDRPTLTEAKDFLKDEMEVYKCDIVLNINQVSKNEVLNNCNWQQIKNPITFKRKEEKSMKNAEKTVLVEIKTKTTKQWSNLCDKLQKSLEGEMFPHVECYSTYEDGEKYPDIMNNKCYEDCEHASTKEIKEVRIDYFDTSLGAWTIDIWTSSYDNEEGIIIGYIFETGTVRYKEGCEEYCIQPIVQEAINDKLIEIEKVYAKTIVTIKSYLEDDGKQKYWVMQGYDKENTEWGCRNIIAYVYLDGTVEWDGDNQAIYEDIPLIKKAIEDKVKEVTIKNKKYYLHKAEEGYNRCYEDTKADLIAEFLAQENTNNKLVAFADDLFMNSASVEETVGYYIKTYGDDALKQWLENVDYITNDTEHKKSVTKALEKLYPTYIRIWYSWGDEEQPVYVSKEEARAKMVELASEEVRICTVENGCGAELVICASDVGKDCRIEYDDGTTCFYKIVNG